MKTERMVLLITPEEKARISTEAGKLGVSASEYVRKLVGILDADDVGELEALGTLMPVFTAAIDSMQDTLARTADTLEEAQREWEYHRSDEYRAKVREEVLADPTIDRAHVAELFGGGPVEREEAA